MSFIATRAPSKDVTDASQVVQLATFQELTAAGRRSATFTTEVDGVTFRSLR